MSLQGGTNSQSPNDNSEGIVVNSLNISYFINKVHCFPTIHRYIGHKLGSQDFRNK